MSAWPRRLVRQRGHVQAAEGDVRARGAVVVGHLVGAARRGDVDLDHDQVRLVVERRRVSTCSSWMVDLVVGVAGSRPASPGPAAGTSEYLIGRKNGLVRLGQRRQDHLDSSHGGPPAAQSHERDLARPGTVQLHEQHALPAPELQRSPDDVERLRRAQQGALAWEWPLGRSSGGTPSRTVEVVVGVAGALAGRAARAARRGPPSRSGSFSLTTIAVVVWRLWTLTQPVSRPAARTKASTRGVRSTISIGPWVGIRSPGCRGGDTGRGLGVLEDGKCPAGRNTSFHSSLQSGRRGPSRHNLGQEAERDLRGR